jgi:RND family efflux transporter MFP subunit
MQAFRATRPGVIPLSLLLALSLLSACDKPPEPGEQIIRPVRMMTIGKDAVQRTLEFPGEIAATRSVQLGFEVPGQIIELPAESGLAVKEGDLLARLDPSNYQSALDGTLAQRRAMRSAYARAKAIFDEGAGSQAEVDATLRDMRVAEANVEKAQKALNDTRLLAPFTGTVGRRIADNFQNVQAKEPILVLQDKSSLEINVNVPERDFVRVTPGLTLEQRTAQLRPEIELSTIPGRRFPARLQSFTTTSDPVTRTYRATFAFSNPEEVNILPGMTARVIVHAPARGDAGSAPAGTVMIPVTATVADDQGHAFVWLVDPDSMQVSRRPVGLGAMMDARVEVTSGLAAGDRIAVSGATHLREGMKVRPLDR